MMAYSDQQLAALLRKAGVPAGDAAILVATAHPESGAADVIQQGQPYDETGWGIWQITPGNSEPQYGTDDALLAPQANAYAAAAKLRSQGLDAWSTVTSGAYKPFLGAAEQAVASVYRMKASQVDELASTAQASAGASGGSLQNAELDSFLSTGSGGVLEDAGALLHGSAIVLDRVFGMFAPGNGWRLAFTGITIGAGFGAYKAYTAGSGQDEGGMLPLAILATGVALTAGFMAARPWPQTSEGAIKPGAYAVDILRGEPPPAGPESFSEGEVELTEAGLATLLSLWAASKAASAVGGIAQAAGAGAGILGKLWSWVGNLGKDAGEGAEDL
jgi:hypothetical protein